MPATGWRSAPVLIGGLVIAQLFSSRADADELKTLLAKMPIAQAEVDRAHSQYVLNRIPPLVRPESAGVWQKDAAAIRRSVLDDVVFRGAPTAWRLWKSRAEFLGLIETKHGYRIRKMRIEALPGLWIPALLYEPDDLQGKVPVVLNVNGHAAEGKANQPKQLRCINIAKRGMIALNIEWIGMGQLRTPGFAHNDLSKLDLCGVAGLSVFYQAMVSGLDVLLEHPSADSKRVAVTGLSGGGWQTIIISALDTRVSLAVPVAGHSALSQRVANRSSIGDLEQNPTDLVWRADYTHLNALMVPRPLLLIYNKQDNCCFAASTVKTNTYEPIIPFYEQAGVSDRLQYYENSDPGTHNYDRDNREQLYTFLRKHFAKDANWSSQEIESTDEVLTAEQLAVTLPDRNADFHSLAAKFAEDLPRPTGGTRQDRRELLKSVLRFEADSVEASPRMRQVNFGNASVTTYRLNTTQKWMLGAHVISAPAEPRGKVVLYIDDQGAENDTVVTALLEDGRQVVAFDPLLIGKSRPSGVLYQNSILLGTVGERALGIQVAQLLAVIHRFSPDQKVEVHSHGPRTSLMARCAAALDGGDMIDSVHPHDELTSLKRLLAPDSSFSAMPEAYCFGLLQHFDIDDLKNLGP